MSIETRREFLRQVLGGLAVPVLGLETGVFGKAIARHENDHPAVHGMVLFGRNKIYLSHLPLFGSKGHRSPHNYQVILEASFSDPKHSRQYLDASAKDPSGLFTIEPEPFVLTDLNSTSDGKRKRVSFRATAYEGHFERGGAPLIKDAELVTDNVVHFRSFDLEEQRPKTLSYIVFGSGGEYYLAHRIIRPPDFDQILAVTVDESLPVAGSIVTATQLIESVESRIKEKQTANCDIISPNGMPSRKTVRLTAVREIYFETEELGS